MRIAGTLELDGSSISLKQAGNATILSAGSPSSSITLSLPTDASQTLVGTSATQTLTNKTLTSPTITSPTITGAATLSVTDNGSNDLIFASSDGAFSADRTLSFDLNNADRTINLAGDLTLAGSLTTSGAYGLTLTLSNTTSVTLPTTGTLATLAGSETLTNKTLTSPIISTISNTGTLTLPTSTDTLVGRATTDTLTNKTLTSPVLTTPTVTTSLQATSDANFALLTNVGVSGTPTITIGAATDGSNYSTVVIAGNLQVDGTTVSVNSTNLDVEDANITINHGGNQASADTNDAGLTVEMSDATDAIIHYDSATTSKWKAGEVGSAAEIVTVSHAQTLTNKTLTSAVLTTPEINDASSDHQFVFAGAELAADRTVTLPALTGGDTFVFEAHTQTLTNKTLTDPAINGGVVDFGTVTDAGGGTPSDKLVVPKAARSVLDSVTRDEAALYYDTDAGQLLVDNGVNLTSVGSGAGGINYIESPDAESGTTGWVTYDDAAATPVDGTGGTVASTWTSQSGTVLRGTKSFLFTKASGAANTGEGVAYDFTLDAADTNRILAISFDFDCSDTDYTAGDLRVYIVSDTGGTPTLITPSQASIPAGTGRFEATWVSTSQTDCRLLIHHAGSSSSELTCYFDNFRVGPDQAVFGPSVGEWEDFTPTINNVGSKVFTNAGKKRRVGSSMELIFNCLGNSTASGSAATTAITVTIPDSLNILTGVSNVGNAATYGITTASQFTNEVAVVRASDTTISFIKPATNDVFKIADLNVARTMEFYVRASVPIAEWAGDTTHLAAARVEYAYSTNTTTTAGNTQTDDGLYGYGSAGTTFVSVASTTANSETTKRVRFQTPIQPTDLIEVEMSEGNNHWVPVGASNIQYSSASTSIYGIRWGVVSGSTTDIYIYFGNQGYRQTNGTYAGSGAAWSVIGGLGWKWRVRKSSPHAPAGIQLATSSTPGLLEQKTKWQRKLLGTSITATTATLTDLTFNNLVVGKTYRATLQAYVSITGTSATEEGFVEIYHNSAALGTVVLRSDAVSDRHDLRASTSVIFTAAATTLTANYYESGTTTLVGGSLLSATWMQLEELGSYEETTAFT